ncbi:MAG: hypothetical protein J6K17_00390, partial [Oscillospiraceae bacterium]|nr:hypothetical protein [Oscillospiraceae bacterium]
STVRDRLQVAETNCKVLRAKIDEVNDVLRNNPDLSREYVKKRDELRGRKGLTNNTQIQITPKHKK